VAEEHLGDLLPPGPPRDVGVMGQQAEHAVVAGQYVSAEVADSAPPGGAQDLL
jgi:hypothetical protein